MGRRGPECTVCESQNYILRNGFYFCTMCQTQSQELGAEMVIDEDGMYAMGMMNKTLRIGEKESNSKTRKTAEVDRWSTAEGLTHILAHWVDQLESYGFKNIRQPALDVWSRYLNSLGVAFLPPKGEMNEDRRSVSTMNYRDKWLFFGGPANLVEPRVISRNLKRKGDQADHEYNDDDDDDDYEGLTERQIFKQRDKKRRAFYKSFSASFVAGDTPSKLSTEKNERKRKELEDLEEHEEHTENEEHEGHAEHEGHEVPNEQDDDKEEEDYENHEERIEPEHQKKEEYTVKDSVQEEQEEDIQNDQEEHQDQELEYEDQEEENQQSVNDSLFSDGSGRSNYELLSDLESLVSRSSLEYSGTDKLETWIHLSLENLKAVLVLAATCVPGTDLNTSDIAYMFSSEMLINSTSLQALPESYKLMASERRFYSGFKSGIVFEKEENLRSKALKLASFIGLTNNKRLVLSTHDCTRSTLDRYVEDLSLPEYISTEIIRIFSKCDLLSITCRVPAYSCTNPTWIDCALPSVSARILALILVTLKFYCGLDGQQEYIHDHNAKTLNKKLVGEDRKFFNILDWIRKSKLRLDYLTADDFVMREQFRSMKGPGTPAPTLRSMDESRTVLENTARKQQNTKSNVFDGLKYVVTDLGAEPLAQKEKMKTLQPLKEKTAALIHETKNKRLASSLNDLMAMTSEDMSIYCKSPGSILNLKKYWIKHFPLKKNIRKIKCLKTSVQGRSIKSARLEGSGETPFCSWEAEPDTVYIFQRRYWDIPLRLASAATYPREYVKRIHCERDLLSLLQILPENFVWILRYFSNYALLPLHVLVSEVYNLEIYLYGLDPTFFGSSTLPVEKPSKIRQREFTTKKRENFKYCDCEKCAEVDRLYPKSSERIT